MKLKILILLFLCATFWSEASAKPFVFTAIPDQDETRLIQRFGMIAKYLEKELGVPVKYIPVKSYAAAIAAFKNNHVQMAWFGGLAGVRARLAVPHSLAIAQGVEDKEFVTYFIAHTSTGLTEQKSFPTAITGKTMTFGSKGSTSGRLMPEFYIRKHMKKKPSEVFRRVGFSGDHSRTIALVQSGAYQVGAVNYKVWETEKKMGKIDPNKIQIIWRTPTYPDYQWTVRGDLNKTWGQGFSEKLTRALLEMKDPNLLASFPRKGFIPAENADYAPIEETARNIGLID